MSTTITDYTQKQQSSLNEFQALLLKRFDNILQTLIPEFVDKAQASNALVMPDSEFFELLYTTVLEKNSRTPERELNKLKRRADNLKLFYKQLDQLGGTMKVGDVADILGITRQAVNLRVKANKLIAIKHNGDHVFPRFQFAAGRLLPHFEDVMKVMDKEVGPVMRISFITSPVSGLDKNPLQIMLADSCAHDIGLMLRAASQVGKQIAD